MKERQDLIPRDSVTQALRLKKLGLEFLSPYLYRLFGLERANSFYLRHQGKPTREFLDAIFEEMEVRMDLDPADLENIPSEGPFWMIANHPMGVWDGIIMTQLLKTRREDFKVITLFFLERVKEVRQHIIPVNNWHDKRDLGNNTRAMREVLLTMQKNGHPIGLFPGGSVGYYIRRYRRITDKPWNPTAIKLMEKVKAPIVPVHIDGRNSNFFYSLSIISTTLRRARNFGEFFNKRGKKIPVRIGKPISVEDQSQFLTTEDLSNYLREQVYALSSE